MRMIKLRVLALGIVLTITGCANINHNLGDERWFNPSLPIHLQHTLFEQEQQFCLQATKHWTPLPDITFSSNGVRNLNGAPNVSVEGASRTVTYSSSENAWPTRASGSGTSNWQKISARAQVDTRARSLLRNCLTALGWQGVNDTWDGTPHTLNETIFVNSHVMTAVDQGFIHPILGDGVIAMISRAESRHKDKNILIKTAEISVSGNKATQHCVYRLTRHLISTRGEVACNGDLPVPVKVQGGSPISTWLSLYY